MAMHHSTYLPEQFVAAQRLPTLQRLGCTFAFPEGVKHHTPRRIMRRSTLAPGAYALGLMVFMGACGGGGAAPMEVGGPGGGTETGGTTTPPAPPAPPAPPTPPTPPGPPTQSAPMAVTIATVDR